MNVESIFFLLRAMGQLSSSSVHIEIIRLHSEKGGEKGNANVRLRLPHIFFLLRTSLWLRGLKATARGLVRLAPSAELDYDSSRAMSNYLLLPYSFA